MGEGEDLFEGMDVRLWWGNGGGCLNDGEDDGFERVGIDVEVFDVCVEEVVGKGSVGLVWFE